MSKSLEGEDIFIGKIIEKQSDAAFNFEDLEGKQYLFKMNNSEDCIIGKNVRVFGINRGLKEYRSVIGTVEMETIDVRHIEIL